MESHRASSVLRDLQTLVRRASGQPLEDDQLHPQYQHQNRLGCDRISGPHRLSHWSQTEPPTHLITRSQTLQGIAAMELHHCTQSVKICEVNLASTLSAALAPQSARLYRGTARNFLTYLGTHHPEVTSLDQLRRDPHILR